jgi:hypothetical protein
VKTWRSWTGFLPFTVHLHVGERTAQGLLNFKDDMEPIVRHIGGTALEMFRSPTAACNRVESLSLEDASFDVELIQIEMLNNSHGRFDQKTTRENDVALQNSFNARATLATRGSGFILRHSRFCSVFPHLQFRPTPSARPTARRCILYGRDMRQKQHVLACRPPTCTPYTPLLHFTHCHHSQCSTHCQCVQFFFYYSA